jgi:hypothetical protein
VVEFLAEARRRQLRQRQIQRGKDEEEEREDHREPFHGSQSWEVRGEDPACPPVHDDTDQEEADQQP